MRNVVGFIVSVYFHLSVEALYSFFSRGSFSIPGDIFGPFTRRVSFNTGI